MYINNPFSLHVFEYIKDKNKSLHKNSIGQECSLWSQFLWLILHFHSQLFLTGMNSVYLFFSAKFTLALKIHFKQEAVALI